MKSPFATRFAGEVRSNVEPPEIESSPETNCVDVPPPGQVVAARTETFPRSLKVAIAVHINATAANAATGRRPPPRIQPFKPCPNFDLPST